MNHQKVYNKIIENAESELRVKLKRKQLSFIYYEKHHIMPKCIGGLDNKENLVLLTAKEHYVCHKLLTYIHKGNRKLVCAFHFMSTSKKYGNIVSSRDYKNAIELQRSTPISKETREKISKINKGKKITKEHIAKIVNNGKITKSKEDYKNKMKNIISGSKNGMYGKIGILSPNYGKHLTEDQKQHLSNLYKNKTLEEIYGVEKATEIKNHINNKGEHNPFFNKHHTTEIKNLLKLQKRKYNISLNIIENIKQDANLITVKELTNKYNFNGALIRRIIAGEYNKGYYEVTSI